MAAQRLKKSLNYKIPYLKENERIIWPTDQVKKNQVLYISLNAQFEPYYHVLPHVDGKIL
jgi:hypothetical protein